MGMLRNHTLPRLRASVKTSWRRGHLNLVLKMSEGVSGQGGKHSLGRGVAGWDKSKSPSQDCLSLGWIGKTGVCLPAALFKKYFIYLFGCAGSQLRNKGSLIFVVCRIFRSVWWHHVGFLVVACKLLVVVCDIQFPDWESNLGPLHWEPGVLAIGPPGKSHSSCS